MKSITLSRPAYESHMEGDPRPMRAAREQARRGVARARGFERAEAIRMRQPLPVARVDILSPQGVLLGWEE
jgi:hypothetical protein